MGLLDRYGYSGETDHRDLMPLAHARRILTSPQGVDVEELWWALASLEDLTEFCRHTCELAPALVEGGPGDLLVARYGDGIIDWVRGFVRGDCLVGRGWPLEAVLCACDTHEAFALLWSLRSVGEMSSGPPDATANGAVLQWIWAFPASGFFFLAELCRAGDPRAALMLRSLAECHPRAVSRYVAWGLGESARREVFAQVGAPSRISAGGVRAVLNFGYATPGAWPRRDDPLALSSHLRLLVWKSEAELDWVVVMERLEGSCLQDGVVRRYVLGSRPTPPGSEVGMNLDLAVATAGDKESVLRGPRGDLPGPLKRSDFPSLLRHYLQAYPTAFMSEPLAIRDDLAWDAELVLVLECGSVAVDLLDAGPPASTAVGQALVDAILGDATVLSRLANEGTP